MVAAIVVSFAVHPHESSAKYLSLAGGMDVILHLLMLHNLVGYTIGSINGNFWSLALECQLYVIFPGLIFLAAKFGFRSLLLVTVILSAAWQITAWKFVPHLSSEDGHYMVLFNAVFGRCFEFAAGMTAASFVARPKPRSTFYAAIAASIFAIIGVCYAYFVTIDGPPMCELWGIVFGCLIVALSSIDDQKLVAHSIPRFFVWVGTISYSIYLIQGIIYSAVFTTAGRHHVHSEAITFPLVIVASIGLGYCFHLMFERPFMKPGSGYFARFSKA
jgi:peptidoglycan/LPS O-acetylase OafA/YrhL